MPMYNFVSGYLVDFSLNDVVVVYCYIFKQAWVLIHHASLLVILISTSLYVGVIQCSPTFWTTECALS